MLLSVITIHLEDFAGLARTLQSIERYLSDPRFEWVLVDGASKCREDEHERILRKALQLSKASISEHDAGIYDAMNKGTRVTTGEYVLYLNAGDELHPNFELDKFRQSAITTRSDMIWGRCQELYRDGTRIDIRARLPSMAWYGMPAYHPGIFFRRAVLGNAPYDASLKIAADYDLVCRLLKTGASVSRTSLPVAIFHRGGLSEQETNVALSEENEIRKLYFRIPAALCTIIKHFRSLNARLSRFATVHRHLRKWV